MPCKQASVRWKTGARWKEGGIGRIDRDLRTRMAHLMGIHKGLRYLFTEPARGYAWIRKPNATFGSQSALDLLLRGEISDLPSIARYGLGRKAELDLIVQTYGDVDICSV